MKTAQPHVSPVGQRNTDAAARRARTSTRVGTNQRAEQTPPGSAGVRQTIRPGVPFARRRLFDVLVLGDNGFVLPFSRVWEFSLMDSDGNMQSRVERDRADVA